METFITLSTKKSIIPKEFRADDNRFTEQLVKYFLERYTKKGDKVFDPFAGLGTSLIVSEKMKRIPFGIEFNKKRSEYIKTKIVHKENIICGNSLEINRYKFPKFDFSITSPPYNPIDEENYLSGKGGYNGFLNDIGRIYTKLKKFMKKDAYLVIEVSNLKGKEITTLAWDIAKEVAKIFNFEGEIVIGWKAKGKPKSEGNYAHGYDHSYCLVFRNK